MIKRFRVQNYKALRDVSLDLTPIHVLIGPNDSGKTSILEALAALCRSVDYPLSDVFAGLWTGRDLVSHGVSDPVISLAAAGTGNVNWEYRFSCRFGSSGRKVQIAEEAITLDNIQQSRPGASQEYTKVYSDCVLSDPLDSSFSDFAHEIREELTGVQYYRWIPRLLSLPAAPDSKRRFRMEATGFGLALCLDDILGYDRDRFIALEREFCGYFPYIQSIKLIAEPAFKETERNSEEIPSFQRVDGKGLHFQHVDGPLVPASQVSDGVLLILAYLAIIHLPEPPRVLLIEEPENGIHPARLRDVLTMLRSLVEKQDRTQVLLTTHSPYVVDLFQPEEVTLTRMQDDGSIAVRRLVDSDLVQRQSGVFTLGEIWTAEGDEALARPAPTAAGVK